MSAMWRGWAAGWPSSACGGRGDPNNATADPCRPPHALAARLPPLALCAPPARPGALASVAMTLARRRIGRRAEDLVAARLAAAGWRILERNARTRLGEIDIV